MYSPFQPRFQAAYTPNKQEGHLLSLLFRQLVIDVIFDGGSGPLMNYGISEGYL